MRSPRLTFPGAFHHVTCRGLNGEKVFLSADGKKAYLDFLAEQSRRLGVRVFAYCMMDNHVHLGIENRDGRLSDCMKRVNGLYGFWYRRQVGGAGYVFQSRFHSALIEGDAYLLQAIAYILNNPVRAKMSGRYDQYPWSSARYYYSGMAPAWLDAQFVEELFGSQAGMTRRVTQWGGDDAGEVATRWGGLWGSREFLEAAVSRWDRRIRADAVKRKRWDDCHFEPVEKVIREFERKHHVHLEEIDTSTIAGKRLRSELLARLKDMTDLTFRKIAEIPIFSDLQSRSLGRLYQNARKK